MNITCRIGTEDYKLFVGVINQGIDSHLQAFIQSKFEHKDDRLVMDFTEEELPILIRRLNEVGAFDWADDIWHTIQGE